MNKLTKIGVSALCGSLAAISAADAGDLSVSGGVDMSWVSLSDQVTGNPIGIGSNMSFTGSGELDNGWAVSLAIALDNKAAYSATNVTVGVPGIGDFLISSGVSGTGIDRMDDKTPTVWEEAYGWGLGSGIDTVAGASGGSGIEFTPSFMPDGLTVRMHASPGVAGSNSNDKAGSGDDGSVSKGGYDVTFEAGDGIGLPAGLSIYGGVADVEQHVNAAAFNSDKSENFRFFICI